MCETLLHRWLSGVCCNAGPTAEYALVHVVFRCAVYSIHLQSSGNVDLVVWRGRGNGQPRFRSIDLERSDGVLSSFILILVNYNNIITML